MVIVFSMPSILLIVFGLFVCFAGYKFFRLSLSLIGAGIGFFLAEHIFDAYSSLLGLAGNDIARFVFVLLIVIGMASLAFYFYMKAVIVTAMIGMGYWINTCYRQYTGDTSTKAMLLTWVAGILLGLIIGFAIKSVQRWAIIIFTAAGGAQITGSLCSKYMIVNSIVEETCVKLGNVIFPNTRIDSQVLLGGILAIMLFTAGVIVQSKGKK
ncbi:MAG: TMEM198/TM7SF3 family protein [Saccharofermentans sp.]|nr:TMEM198/TM7SF3 family protein [Saccharofermentans sp.]